MTKLGEQTGNIAGSYARLADILGEIRDNSSKFRKAIRYPLITLLAIATAFTILIVVVVPKFKEIFDKFNADLPIPTQILLSTEYFLNHYGYIFSIVLLMGTMITIYFYQNSRVFKYKVDGLLVHPYFYLIHKIIFLSAMYEYTLVFGELIKAGIPVSEALDTAVNIVGNSSIREKLLTVNTNIGRGMSLTEAFDQTGLFENILLQMIRAGERGGQLDAMIEKVTAYYAMRFQEIVDNLSTYIEPVLLFFISALVLLMALGIFLPMWDLGRVVGG
jgi:type II secretory pathway component PulF